MDASALIPTLVAEPTSAAISAYLADETVELLVSDFAAAEVAAAVSRLVRTRLLAADVAMARLTDFDVWRAEVATSVEVRPGDVQSAYAFVRRFDLMLHAPDALHLAIAKRLGAGLVTLDRALARAARTLGIAATVPLGAR